MITFRYMITIDPTYHSIMNTIQINKLLKTYKQTCLSYYNKKYKKKAHLYKDEQYQQMICSHLYYVKSSNELEYLLNDKLSKEYLKEKYNPHLHILVDTPASEIMDFFFFIKKKMRVKYPYSKCDFIPVKQNQQDQIKAISYADKEQSIFYTKSDLINGVI